MTCSQSLRRHQLATPSPTGWQAILRGDWDDEVLAGLLHWAAHELPLVVTRQPVPRPTAVATVALGLCLPERWGRRLVALRLLPQLVGRWHEFPALSQLLSDRSSLIPTAARQDLEQACVALTALGVRAHVYGSFGWQFFTRQSHVHPRSDLDLWLAVSSSSQADAAVEVLHRHAPASLRIDGELVFPDGSATAWREWQRWRAGHARSLLVKNVNGAALQDQLQDPCPLPAAGCEA